MPKTTITFLEVPFAQQDQAKMLGARWDPLKKKWYVPDGLSLIPFKMWLSEDGLIQDQLPTPPHTHPLISESGDSVCLSAFLQEVSGAIMERVKRSQWVRVEISQLRPINGGHLALELVEHDGEGKLIARLQGFLWNSRAQTVLARFQETTGAVLEVGIKVLFQLTAEFNATYGLRAIIEDIDPTFTLGDIAAKLNAIREGLIQRGVYDLNRKLPCPTEFCKVAVISPREAAGLGDFRQDADRLQSHGICEFTYYTATFQGPDTSGSLLEAIHRLREDVQGGQAFDAVCLIRGGGSVTDLYWLNDEAVAEAIARLEIPVLTGIGHERDNTILDEIANQRFDTPSKVIGHIEGTLYGNTQAAIENLLIIFKTAENHLARGNQDVEDSLRRIVSLAQEQLLHAEHRLDRDFRSIQYESNRHLEFTDFEIIRTLDSIGQRSALIIDSMMRDLEYLRIRLHDLSLERLKEAEQMTEAFAREVLGLGPKATLSRGFALAHHMDGPPITSTQSARLAHQFNLEFHDGTIPVIIPPEGESHD